MKDNQNQIFTVEEIPLAKIRDFKNHPFKVKDDAEMEVLLESIREIGLIEPITVRPVPVGEYEIISGHRRRHAYERLGKDSIPCRVVQMLIEQATVMMVDSNLKREHVLPSEKAFAYKMKLDAVKCQGQRSDITSTPMAGKLKGESADMVGKEAGDSGDQVHRYIRLTALIPELLGYVDEGKIALRPAVELSYLDETAQQNAADVIAKMDTFPTHAQARRMRELGGRGELNYETVLKILSELKPNQKEMIRLPMEDICRLLPEECETQKECTEYILKVLELVAQRREQFNQKKAHRLEGGER